MEDAFADDSSHVPTRAWQVLAATKFGQEDPWERERYVTGIAAVRQRRCEKGRSGALAARGIWLCLFCPTAV